MKRRPILPAADNPNDVVPGGRVRSGCDPGLNSHIRKPRDFHQFAGVITQPGRHWLAINESPHAP